MKTADLIGIKILNPVFHWLDYQIHMNGDFLFHAFWLGGAGWAGNSLV